MEGQAPPRCLVLLGDWSNVFAGLSLVVSFGVLCLALTFNAFELTDPTVHAIFQWTMAIEGILWALGGGILAAVNVIANNASLAVVQTIICFGGIFFAISGFGDGLPGNIISLPYVVPISDFKNTHLQDACPFWGITCFMVGTSISLRGVWQLPKNRLVSPFWGVACFWLGAWTIGVFALWGPCLVDGIIHYEDLKDGEQFNLPPFAWSWIHVFQVIGAVFLTMGAVIFGMMDGIFGCRSPTSTKELSDSDEESNSTEAD
mmetsp:Transcript_103399/g.232122  ORF Transcript_103399/g.232122 Transcript_103399/m.232122 type:complete len:260 (-) Transcript_103399:162-941(-)